MRPFEAKPQVFTASHRRKAVNLGSKHQANSISLKLFCRASAARATARRCSLGIGRIVPSSAAVRGSGKPRGQRVPCTSTSDGLRSAAAQARPSVPQPADAVCSTGGARPSAATSLRPSAPVALRMCHASSGLRGAAPLTRVCSAPRASAARPSLRAPFAPRRANGGTRSPRVRPSLARTASAAVPMLASPRSCAPGRGTCAVRAAEATRCRNHRRRS